MTILSKTSFGEHVIKLKLIPSLLWVFYLVLSITTGNSIFQTMNHYISSTFSDSNFETKNLWAA